MTLFSNCDVNDEGVRVRVFFFTKTIPFAKIKSVQRVSFWGLIFKTMDIFRPPMFNTGYFPLTGGVVIETTTSRWIAVIPENADEFVRLVASRLVAAG